MRTKQHCRIQHDAPVTIACSNLTHTHTCACGATNTAIVAAPPVPLECARPQRPTTCMGQRCRKIAPIWREPATTTPATWSSATEVCLNAYAPRGNAPFYQLSICVGPCRTRMPAPSDGARLRVAECALEMHSMLLPRLHACHNPAQPIGRRFRNLRCHADRRLLRLDEGPTPCAQNHHFFVPPVPVGLCTTAEARAAKWPNCPTAMPHHARLRGVRDLHANMRASSGPTNSELRCEGHQGPILTTKTTHPPPPPPPTGSGVACLFRNAYKHALLQTIQTSPISARIPTPLSMRGFATWGGGALANKPPEVNERSLVGITRGRTCRPPNQLRTL